MSVEFYTRDRTTHCPCCGDCNSDFLEVPEHTRSWEDEQGVKHVTHMPAQRDYECRNCSHEWTMGPPEID